MRSNRDDQWIFKSDGKFHGRKKKNKNKQEQQQRQKKKGECNNSSNFLFSFFNSLSLNSDRILLYLLVRCALVTLAVCHQHWIFPLLGQQWLLQLTQLSHQAHEQPHYLQSPVKSRRKKHWFRPCSFIGVNQSVFRNTRNEMRADSNNVTGNTTSALIYNLDVPKIPVTS